MWSSISSRLAEALVGLLVAGLVMGLLVPALGSAAGTGLAAFVGISSIAGVMWAAHRVRTRARRP